MRAAGCGTDASWLGDVLTGERNWSRLGVLPSCTERLHTYHVASKYSGSAAATQVANRLTEAARSPDHEFRPADIKHAWRGCI